MTEFLLAVNTNDALEWKVIAGIVIAIVYGLGQLATTFKKRKEQKEAELRRSSRGASPPPGTLRAPPPETPQYGRSQPQRPLQPRPPVQPQARIPQPPRMPEARRQAAGRQPLPQPVPARKTAPAESPRVRREAPVSEDLVEIRIEAEHHAVDATFATVAPLHPAGQAAQAPATAAKQQADAARRQLLAALRMPASTRSAILLSEILGSPVALRSPDNSAGSPSRF